MKPYESYKETNIPWVKKMPSHWEFERIGKLFLERKTKVSDKYYPPISVTKKGVLPQLATAAKSDDSDNRKLVQAGDFVINSRSDRKSSSGISPLTGSVSLINIVLKPRQDNNSFFMNYLLRSNSFVEEYYRNGRGIVADLWTTRFSEMKTIMLPVPPRREQDQIVRFLDWKLSKINKLIKAKKKQIELLKEQKQAIINKAVTKGLDDNVPMKDSGVGWIGEIPQGWEKIRLGKIVTIILSGLDKKSYEGQKNVFLCNYVDVYKNDYITNSIDFMKATASSVETENLNLMEDDVIITKDSESWDDIGVAAYFPKEIENLLCAYHLAILRTNKSVLLGEYLFYLFKSQYVRLQHKIKAKGVTRFALGYQAIHDTYLLVPSIDEQKEIVIKLKIECNTQNSLIATIEKELDLITEYLTSLISSVVTGKVDVRDVLVPEFEVVEGIVENTEDDEDEMEEE